MLPQSKFHYLFNPYTLYCLLEFNVSKKMIDQLVEYDFVVNDFLTESNKVSQLQTSKKAMTGKVMNAIALLSIEAYEQSVYKLGAAGLSLSNIRLLVDHDITYHQLDSMTYDVFFERIGRKNKKVIFERIIEAFRSCEELFQADITAKTYHFYLHQYCEQLPPRHYVTKDTLSKELSVQLNIPETKIDVESIELFLHKKMMENYLTFTSDLGFKRNVKTIKQLLADDFKDKEILIRRMKGESLQQIGDSLNLSRERIRQREAKLLSKLPELEELTFYKDVFEVYDWDEELFSAVYGEIPEVYQLLNVKLDRGERSVLDSLDELSLTAKLQELVLAHLNCYINYEKKVVPYNNKLAFFEHLMFHFGQKTVSNEEFNEVANEYITEHRLDPSLYYTERSAMGLIDRSRKIIRTKSNSFRFYDVDKVDPEMMNHLKELLDLDPGVYHMAKIFNENEALMVELNIDSGHELHNLYKRYIEIDGVTFTKMPEFCVQTSKKEFLKSLFYELAPISIEDFLDYVENNYGLRQDSLHSLLYSNDNDYLPYLHNHFIKVSYEEVSEAEYSLVESLLKNDLYTVQELIKLGSEHILDFKEKFVNNQALMKLNYSLKGMFVLNRKYSSIDQYFTRLILKNDMFRNTRSHHFKTNHFLSALYDLEKKLEVVKVAPDMYLTSRKIEGAGITKDELVVYREAAYHYSEAPFFTYYSLKQEGFEQELEDYGFDEVFYERIIWTHPKLRALNTKNCTIFSKTGKEFTLKEFLEWLVSKDSEPLDLDVLKTRLKREFGIDLNKDKLIRTIQNTAFYYSREMNKVYQDKERFYETIYSGER
ncbi:sigma factor-like helix-turn-helix DNA-binding protein [Alkalibacillus silvisoli]|uniref:RNA polymerase sigma-70 region 4 domain-containing protein n=1 Tax=Alkalibacillus silvisoli TaxID=392823 RepID=A0ABP3JRH6_9BACI